MGFAVANRAYVADDIRSGRLVAPFAVHHPNSAGWYLVYPKQNAPTCRLVVFRRWLMAEAAEMQLELDAGLHQGANQHSR